MKFAILNDTHCGVRNDNIQFHELQRKFYEDVFFPYLLKHDIKHISRVDCLILRVHEYLLLTYYLL